jgi:Kef-type K+ transport system membrane component KefB
VNDPQPTAGRKLVLLAYGAMLVAAVGVYLWIRARGSELAPSLPPVAPEPGLPASGGNLLAHVLLGLAVVTLLTRGFGHVFRRFLRQPPVMGEIVAGLVLGPSVLGALVPGVQRFVLPDEAVPYLGMISKVGVVLFMFLVGLDLDPRPLRRHSHVTVAISHASILAPFLLGAALALWLYPREATSAVSFTSFSLFLGIALSVTAFPVLARILVDRGVQRTPLGTTALACAAVDDVTAWTLLALLAGSARADVGEAGRTLFLLLAYVAVMLAVVRPLAARLVAREQRADGPLSRGVLSLVFVALLLSAVATEAIGVHALFGAFLLGVLLPHDGRLARELRQRLEDFVLVLLLPSFFAFSGLRTEIGLLGSGGDWLACGLIVAVATLGKLGGTAAAARWSGLAWRPALALGLLMNTRGLMQLIVLNLGLDLGVITPRVFTMMVLMALVTTFAATPALDLLLGEGGFRAELRDVQEGELRSATPPRRGERSPVEPP